MTDEGEVKMKGLKNDLEELSVKRNSSDLRIKDVKNNIVKELNEINDERILTLLYLYTCNLRKM